MLLLPNAPFAIANSSHQAQLVGGILPLAVQASHFIEGSACTDVMYRLEVALSRPQARREPVLLRDELSCREMISDLVVVLSMPNTTLQTVLEVAVLGMSMTSRRCIIAYPSLNVAWGALSVGAAWPLVHDQRPATLELSFPPIWGRSRTRWVRRCLRLARRWCWQGRLPHCLRSCLSSGGSRIRAGLLIFQSGSLRGLLLLTPARLERSAACLSLF
mmetsp:Transcript_22369/g.48972  ORF Transcript_22369/g.48972 Transcript_22369/m.48972 type:complete len:217 (-) Transcript_22369:159-809(-)